MDPVTIATVQTYHHQSFVMNVVQSTQWSVQSFAVNVGQSG